ncbi:hypothetical protein B7494_g4806 [Chlorociboria aeruginascens]|nr:hypothetical protein B7494_g4806 [Chlorociboria aeruginascens]
MTNFNIEIVSDTVCPWCYIGKQKLDQAIAAYKTKHPDSDDTFSITWLPFYLNPAAPKLGVDKWAYYDAKFGAERAAQMRARLTEVGTSVGIDFKFGGKSGNTRDSHRLVQLGRTRSAAVQTRVVEELFRSYFENEGDITSHENLAAAAVRAGLEDDEVRQCLQSDTGGAEVDREVEAARRSGVTGVPNFTVQGRYEVGGAQEPAVFLGLFEKIKMAEAAARA